MNENEKFIMPSVGELEHMCETLKKLKFALEPMPQIKVSNDENMRQIFENREIFSDWIETMFNNLKDVEYGLCSNEEKGERRALITIGVLLQTVNDVRNILNEILEEEEDEE